MKSFPYPSYLRTHRDGWALTQPELGLLLGVSGSQISRYEKLVDQPTLPSVIAAEFIFEEPARHLFPGIYMAVEQSVIARTADLRERIGLPKTRKAERKLLLLDALAARAASDQTTI